METLRQSDIYKDGLDCTYGSIICTVVVQIYTLYRVVNAPSNTVLPFAKIIYPQSNKYSG